MSPSPASGPPALLCEGMLGRLATWLRLLGYDAPLLLRPPAITPPGAVLITRRRRLAGRPGVLFIIHDRLEEQLWEVLAGLGLRPDPARLFSRCLRCNQPVEPLARGQAQGLVPEFTLHTAANFTRCPGCGRVFWPGSHGQRAQQRIAQMLSRLSQGTPAEASD